MQRFRKAVHRMLTSAGPSLLLVGAVCAAGFALHAADDWHHHGEMSAGFFHLHFHVGEHHHDEHEHADHQHQAPDDHGEHDSDTHERHESRVLTVAQSVSNPSPSAPAVPAPEAVSETEPDSRYGFQKPQRARSTSNPRAPPA